MTPAEHLEAMEGYGMTVKGWPTSAEQIERRNKYEEEYQAALRRFNAGIRCKNGQYVSADEWERAEQRLKQ